MGRGMHVDSLVREDKDKDVQVNRRSHQQRKTRILLQSPPRQAAGSAYPPEARSAQAARKRYIYPKLPLASVLDFDRVFPRLGKGRLLGVMLPDGYPRPTVRVLSD